ncbi:MAG: hypothetical protein K0S06_2736 [Microvirga sp.]|jgi:hypothetical protein|nr:hypothetical protein [Microvirga sp.]
MLLEDLALWLACGGAIVVGLTFSMVGWSIADPP